MMSTTERGVTNLGVREQNHIHGNDEKTVGEMTGLIGIYIDMYIHLQPLGKYKFLYISNAETNTIVDLEHKIRKK